jgi:DNA-binding Lrp family transcriptional regulator
VTSPLEAIDRAILRELVGDGRCTLTDLAERVGLSVSAVHQRVGALSSEVPSAATRPGSTWSNSACR